MKTILSFKNWPILVKIVLFILLAYFPIFLHLDTLPVRLWDEARLAINAYEMNKDRDFLVTHYLGNPDMWNTKPPLMIWLQVFFIKLLGVGELAIRLPSAIAAFLTCLLILSLSIKYLKDYWFGLIAVLILITSHGYINMHASRTGDYDALLTFFTTAFCFSFFLFLESHSNKYLHLFFAALTLAVLTKSAQGLFFLPALFIYSLVKKQFIALLKNKWLWIDLLICIAIIAGYYLLREIHNPGYLQAVWDNELWGRYAQPSEGHGEDFGFYFNNFIAFQFPLWYWLIPCGIVFGCASNNPTIRNLSVFSAIAGLTYFLIASSAKTKLEWYDVPLYPFLAVLCAVTISWLFVLLERSSSVLPKFKLNFTPYLFLLFVFYVPYRTIINKVYMPKEYVWDQEFYSLSYYLKQVIKGERNLDKKSLCYVGYNAPYLFYLCILDDCGKHLTFADMHTLKSGDVVIVMQPQVKTYLEEHYSCKIEIDPCGITTYKILEPIAHES